MRKYELFSAMYIPGRWMLAEPVDEQGQRIDSWQFFEGRTLELPGMSRLTLARPGRALDFSLTTLSIPVVHGRVVTLFRELGVQGQVQFFPAQVQGQSDPYFILNALQVIRCIDDERCEQVAYWKPEDGAPDRLGDYRLVRGLRVDPSEVGDAHVFRPRGWLSVLIVSEQIKHALEEAAVSGTEFTEV